MCLACMIGPMPMVKAERGCCSEALKKRELASSVRWVSATSCVGRTKKLEGSLNPICPLCPMPSSCKSMPPAARMPES